VLHSSAILPRRAACVAAIGLLFASAGAAHADRIYVNRAVPASGDGASWGSAFADLNSALAIAEAGDEIWVARGVYRPAPAGGSRNASFVLKTGVALFGGFVGDEVSRELRDPAANPSVLSGDLNADDGPAFANTGDNCYRVVTAVSLGSGVILDGFVIEGGRADGASGPTVAGSRDSASALLIEGSQLTLIDCVFRRNWGLVSGAVADIGPGSMFLGCSFIQNHAEDGGAGLLIGESAEAIVDTCRFVDNSTIGDGAGMLIRPTGVVQISMCEFTGNSAQRGGGVCFAPAAAGDVSGCEFRVNAAHEGGGLAAIESSPVIDSCLFVGNSAVLSGGGTFAEAGSPSILHCTFTFNHAAEGLTEGLGGQGGSGGGGSWYRGGAGLVRDTCYSNNVASLGAGLYVIEDNHIRVEHCMFQLGRANEAGGFYTLSSAPTLVDCLFTDNAAFGGSFGVGGGVSNYFSASTLENCQFERNFAGLGGGGIYNEGDAPVIRRCVFRQNSAFDPAGGWGGGILNGFNTAATIENCEFTANAARYGGGIADHFNSVPHITNCTLVANQATEQGGGVHALLNAGAVYRNCVISGNSPEQVTGHQSVNIGWSLVEGGHVGIGNFSAIPGFVREPDPGEDLVWGTHDDDLGDLRPARNSPIIDAGDPDVISDVAGGDVMGEPRLRDDPGAPDVGPASGMGRPAVDLGAFEFQGVSCPADFNGDLVITVPDIFSFLSAWFAGSSAADINRSRALGVDDIFAYLSAYFAGCP